MIPFNSNKNIEDVDDYIGWANDIFEGFLSTFTKENGLVRDVTEDDSIDHEKFNFIYTAKGTRLADKMKCLLIKVGEKHFPNEDIEIESYLFQED